VIRHWSAGYVGRPYDRQTFNCWTLIRDVYRDHVHLELSDIQTQNDAATAREMVRNAKLWTEIETPAEFDVVLMRHRDHAVPTHVGIATGRGSVLHTEPVTGTV
jgi:cell wall-associated NlpC family hydrolase